MNRFVMPEWLKEHHFEYDPGNLPDEKLFHIRSGLERFRIEEPMVSIIIPAYNEEHNLFKTLSSIAFLKTQYSAELIISNNNSTDRTQSIIDACGVRSIFVRDQGISYARQAGLEVARGTYIINADSDSVYPSHWLDTLVEPLMRKSEISCTYGTYSFIPSPGNNRFSLGFYEVVSEGFFKLKKRNRECVNVMGFNFAFRKEDALKVGGYEHNLNREITGRSEDGWMALRLMKIGQLQQICDLEARVWTSDRRLMEDGSIAKAFTSRALKELRRLRLYVNGKYAADPDETIEMKQAP